MEFRWRILSDGIPTVYQVGEKVLIFRETNPSQTLLAYVIYDTKMLKHCDPESTWWCPLVEHPLHSKLGFLCSNAHQFNAKYKEFLVDGNYGLDIHIPELVRWLDEKFQLFIKYPNFKYYQIKEKYGQGRFWVDGISDAELVEVEAKIAEIIHTKKLETNYSIENHDI